ncbi:MAG: pantoate--beta-alanine ligase [Rhizomicrobium sp.]|jgi:pantoate--beta-alanine ligase
MSSADIVTTVASLRTRVSAWRREGLTAGLVPTMGALHEGHLALVRETAKRASRTIVSIFVNPAQFAPHEDFDRYPRALDADIAKLGSDADLVFAPSVAEMYPDGFATKIEVGGPGLGLETDFRPHFFAGVATVVAKLLIAALPDSAMFGEKDYQQLLVVKRLVRDLALPVEIVGGAIVREADGLAMSSRNAYLSPREREIAGTLNRVVQDAAQTVRDGAGVASVEANAARTLLENGFDAVDYVAVRDAETLDDVRTGHTARVLAAVRVGKTRLIDNMAV